LKYGEPVVEVGMEKVVEDHTAAAAAAVADMLRWFQSLLFLVLHTQSLWEQVEQDKQ
jgi:hypothetical protein